MEGGWDCWISFSELATRLIDRKKRFSFLRKVLQRQMGSTTKLGFSQIGFSPDNQYLEFSAAHIKKHLLDILI